MQIADLPEKPPIKPIVCHDLEEIEKACREAAPSVRAVIHGKVFELPVRYVTPVEHERLNRIAREVSAPIVPVPDKDGNMGKGYDLADPNYQRELEKRLKIARGLCLYWCCPPMTKAVQAKAGQQIELIDPDSGETRRFTLDPNNREHISDFISTKLTSQIQIDLYNKALGLEQREDDLTGF